MFCINSSKRNFKFTLRSRLRPHLHFVIRENTTPIQATDSTAKNDLKMITNLLKLYINDKLKKKFNT